MLFANLKTDASIEDERDSVGNTGILESGLYEHIVKLAYFNTSKNGSMSLELVLADAKGREIRQQLRLTSGDDKGNKNYYETKDGEKKYLPGFNLANSLSLLTIGKEIGDLVPEEKVIGIYSYTEKKDIATKVPMLMELLNQPIITGLIRQKVYKRVKDAQGKYVPSGETRIENEIDKFFRAKDCMTTAEIRGQNPTAVFINTWEAKWKGVDRDKTTKGAVAPVTPVGGAKPTASLFAAPAP